MGNMLAVYFRRNFEADVPYAKKGGSLEITAKIGSFCGAYHQPGAFPFPFPNTSQQPTSNFMRPRVPTPISSAIAFLTCAPVRGRCTKGSWRLEETDFRKMLVEFSLRSNNLETYQIGTVIYINEHDIRFGGSQSFCQKTSRNGCNGKWTNHDLIKFR